MGFIEQFEKVQRFTHFRTTLDFYKQNRQPIMMYGERYSMIRYRCEVPNTDIVDEVRIDIKELKLACFNELEGLFFTPDEGDALKRMLQTPNKTFDNIQPVHKLNKVIEAMTLPYTEGENKSKKTQ